MDRDQKIFGGFIVVVLLIFTFTPLNEMVQALATGASSNDAIEAFASIYDIFHAGMIFAVGALTLTEIFKV